MNQLASDDELRQAGERIRLRVGSLAAGTRLPPERDLAAQLNLSRGHLRDVLAQLAEEGMVTRRRGAGTFVADVPTSVASSLSRELSRRGLRFEVRLLSFDRVPAPTDSPLTGEVLRIRRARTVAGETVCVETSHVCGDADITASDVTRGSLYARLARLGMAPVAVRERLSATVADERAADIFGCALGAPLFRVQRIGLTAAGVIVEDVVTLLRGTDFQLVTASDDQSSGGLADLLTYIPKD